jgi:ADP-ribosylglycohydrolase
MREDQFVGCIVGLAVGDALGYPAEFRSREQLLREIGPAGITDFLRLKDDRFTRPIIIGADHPPGTFTDDTQMSLAVAEALLAAGEAGLEALMTEVGRRFVAWSQSPDNDRSPGSACLSGCAALRRGVPWREAGVAGSKGCGSAMRVAAIGLYFDDLDEVAETARASSLLTHRHDAALEGAAAAALMVALALRGCSAEEMHREIAARCAGRSADFDGCWRRVPDLIARPPEQVLVEGGLGEAWIAEEAVASALYCVWRHLDDYRGAVLEAVNTDGDSDSIAAIAGSVSGARLGLEAIPRRWVDGVERAAQLRAVAQRLWAASGHRRAIGERAGTT